MPEENVIVDDFMQLIGGTPLIRLNNLATSDMAEIVVKMESLNPARTVKDRIALSMIDAAERDGHLKPGMTIVEPTSGNTGIGLAMVATARGYRLILTMPDSMSRERRDLLESYGAELILTPGDLDMPGAVAEAERIVNESPETTFMPQQFNNPANPEIHRQTTAREILEAVDGHLDAFVAGIGTGGTITGVGEVLKAALDHVRVIAVEPAKSPVLSGGEPALHGIQGIGAGFVPSVLNRDIFDALICVRDEDAIKTARKLGREEGILAGISAGANVFAALQIARDLGPGKRVATIICDSGERYFSVPEFLQA
ncbi:MAG: cysteine synthase A [Gemmatimonadetes bacterium]|nr:cysteine synthase A [Gemmatimonadota bacterium]MXX12473.1 cysteine synthase A [Gemmatimonadota bacterium]MXZ11156.1 cysteine synthase A [Gemmatimonadota bacterium]MYB59499.1 cysteine synthase A [Gemmatimonadota bacterium]MYC14904.1 cysteine synthase A [Gemmatimonadota bacterium]